MKKIILLFILVIGMTGVAFAQQNGMVTIIPPRGDIVEKAHISSDKYAVVYFVRQYQPAKKDSTKYYIVTRLLKETIDGVDYHTFKLFFGTMKNITEIKGTSFEPGDQGVIATTPTETITFPHGGDAHIITKKDTVPLERLPRD